MPTSTLYPTAPISLPFPKLPTVSPQQWRMLQYGPYLFAGTFQERNRESKLALIKKKIPFSPGDYNPGNTSMAGRTIEFFGSIVTGMIGANFNKLKTQDDIENERSLLAGLQALGKQSLYTRPDRFLWAWLEDFTESKEESTGFRMSNWTCKFYADDPRYYGATSGPLNQGATQGTGGLPSQNHVQYSGTADGTFHSHALVQAGNTPAFPIFVLTVLPGSPAALHNPIFTISIDPTAGNNGIGLAFSKFNATNQPLNPGDQLVLICDPRPEFEMIAATYYPGGGWPGANSAPTNGLAFVAPSDFINKIDFQYWRPWISSSTVDDGSGGMNTFNFQADNNGATFTIDLYYWDTWI